MKEVPDPQRYVDELRSYLSNPSVRPQERIKDCYMVGCTREWSLALKRGSGQGAPNLIRT